MEATLRSAGVEKWRCPSCKGRSSGTPGKYLSKRILSACLDVVSSIENQPRERVMLVCAAFEGMGELDKICVACALMLRHL